MMRSSRYFILAVLVLAALLSLGISSGVQDRVLVQYDPECTVTVQPGESIQAAIDAAAEGAVICLAEGTWEENIKIEKSLTLQGTGEKTVIRAMGRHPSIIPTAKWDYPLVWITTPEQVTQTVSVKVDGLTITKAQGECMRERICADGVLIQGAAQVEIIKSTVSKNERCGIVVEESARAEITESIISDNKYAGIALLDSAQAEIKGSNISENEYTGISLEHSAQAVISNSRVSKNRHGILLGSSAQAKIDENIIAGNTNYGIFSLSDGEIQGSGNKIFENGTDLRGNLPGTLREPLVEATQEEIIYPNEGYDSLQWAVDALLPGGRLILQEGEYEDNVLIGKELRIESAEGAGVTLALTLLGGTKLELVGLKVTGGSFELGADAHVEITNCTISSHIWLLGSAHAVITDSIMSCGITLKQSARVEVTRSILEAAKEEAKPGSAFGILGGIGIDLWGSAQAVITDSTISGYTIGIGHGDIGMEVEEGLGIAAKGTSRVTITNSTISDNSWDGVSLRYSAQTEITGSTISGNGNHGISLGGQTEARLAYNSIEDNVGCGVAAWGSGHVQGEGNRMSSNGNDLCGNLSGALRVPLTEPIEKEITYTDERYDSLQWAVDALLPGGRLILQEGEYEEGLTIAKELRIEAAEGAEVVLKGQSEKFPILCLVGGAGLELIGMTLAGEAELDSAVMRPTGFIVSLGSNAWANIASSRIAGNRHVGIWLSGSAKAEIADSTISGNWCGITLGESTQAQITNSTISGNSHGGLLLEDTAQATITYSTISGSIFGIELSGFTLAEITDSTISENWYGILLSESAHAQIANSSISKNSCGSAYADTCGGGIRLEETAQAEIAHSIIFQNKHGILLGQSAQATIRGNTIIKSECYGVALCQESCPFFRGAFSGHVSGCGNTIPDKEELNGNQWGGVCPDRLNFLKAPCQGEE